MILSDVYHSLPSNFFLTGEPKGFQPGAGASFFKALSLALFIRRLISCFFLRLCLDCSIECCKGFAGAGLSFPVVNISSPLNTFPRSPSSAVSNTLDVGESVFYFFSFGLNFVTDFAFVDTLRFLPVD